MRKPTRQSFFYKGGNETSSEPSQREILAEDPKAQEFEEAITDFTTSVGRSEL